MPRVAYQPVIVLKAAPVQDIANIDAERKHDKKEAVGKHIKGTAEIFVHDIKMLYRRRRRNLHGFIEKIIEEEAKDAKSKAAVIEIIAFMPCMRARKDCRDDKAKHDDKTGRQGNPGSSQTDRAKHIILLLRIAEQKLADERAEGGRKHTDMQIIFKIQLMAAQIDKRSQKAWQHGQQVQAVKTMGDHQEIAGQRVGVGFPF